MTITRILGFLATYWPALAVGLGIGILFGLFAVRKKTEADPAEADPAEKAFELFIDSLKKQASSFPTAGSMTTEDIKEEIANLAEIAKAQIGRRLQDYEVTRLIATRFPDNWQGIVRELKMENFISSMGVASLPTFDEMTEIQIDAEVNHLLEEAHYVLGQMTDDEFTRILGARFPGFSATITCKIGNPLEIITRVHIEAPGREAVRIQL